MQPLITPRQSEAPLFESGLFKPSWYLFFTALHDYAETGAGLAGIAQYGTRAARLAAGSLPDGAIWTETDTTLVYQWRAASVAWFYVEGLYARTQAQLGALAATLGVQDTGLLVNVTDYAHILQWSGSAWQWGPGESGSGRLEPFAVAPTGSGWHLCDGTAGVKYLKSDGTTATVTLPNTNATSAFMKLGSAYASAITAATVPTISAPAFTGTPVTPTGTVAAIAASGTGSVNVSPAGATAVAAAAHTHAAPAFTGNALTPAGTVSAPTSSLPADPVANFGALLYFRQ